MPSVEFLHVPTGRACTGKLASSSGRQYHMGCAESTAPDVTSLPLDDVRMSVHASPCLSILTSPGKFSSV